jgi:hypothetical protein
VTVSWEFWCFLRGVVEEFVRVGYQAASRRTWIPNFLRRLMSACQSSSISWLPRLKAKLSFETSDPSTLWCSISSQRNGTLRVLYTNAWQTAGSRDCYKFWRLHEEQWRVSKFRQRVAALCGSQCSVSCLPPAHCQMKLQPHHTVIRNTNAFFPKTVLRKWEGLVARRGHKRIHNIQSNKMHSICFTFSVLQYLWTNETCFDPPWDRHQSFV